MEACQGYESSSSDGDYGSSDVIPSGRRRKTDRRASIPPPQDLLAASKTKTIEMRLYPHEEGKFPLHVYISLESNIDSSKVASFKLFVTSRLHAIHKMMPVSPEQLHEVEDHHISLTRPVSVTKELGIRLINDLRTVIEKRQPFGIRLEGAIRYLENENGTRSFAVVSVLHPESVNHLIDDVNQILKRLSLKVFFEKPKPHASLAWAATNTLTADTFRTDGCLDLISQAPSATIRIDHLECQLGQRTYSVPLHGD